MILELRLTLIVLKFCFNFFRIKINFDCFKILIYFFRIIKDFSKEFDVNDLEKIEGRIE